MNSFFDLATKRPSGLQHPSAPQQPSGPHRTAGPHARFPSDLAPEQVGAVPTDGEAIGANAYCRDAAVASETATKLVAERRAAA